MRLIAPLFKYHLGDGKTGLRNLFLKIIFSTKTLKGVGLLTPEAIAIICTQPRPGCVPTQGVHLSSPSSRDGFQRTTSRFSLGRKTALPRKHKTK